MRDSLGSLSKTKDNRWRGQWFVETHDKNGVVTSKRKVAYFGHIPTVSKVEAWAAFRKHVERSRKGAYLNSRSSTTTRTWFVPDPLARGVAGEMMVCVDLLSKGWEVFKNINPTGKIDLLAMAPGGIEAFRIQVKSGSVGADGRPVVSLGEQRSRMDILAVVLDDGQVRYFDQRLKEILRPTQDQYETELQLKIVSD